MSAERACRLTWVCSPMGRGGNDVWQRLICIFIFVTVGACSSNPKVVPASHDPLAIEGIVLDSAGMPVAGAIIAYSPTDAAIPLGTADSVGRFSVTMPKPGHYVLVAVHPTTGEVAHDSVEVPLGPTQSVTFRFHGCTLRHVCGGSSNNPGT